MKPMLRIGKSGLSSNVVSEIKMQLKKKKMIKIRFLRAALNDKNRKELKEEVLDKTNAELVSYVGNVITIRKPENIYNKNFK
jgi:RNA-binding protein